jgi:HAD superfamily hydrolase (TIGR01509 family)
MALDGVILDIDGTLVLSNDAHAHSWVEAFASQGYDVPFDQVRSRMGMGGDQLMPQVIPDLDKEQEPGKTIANYRKELVLRDYVPHIESAPGARALVKKMLAAGLHLVVASSASREELEAMLKIAAVEDLLHETTSSNDAEKSKPAPDLVEAALQKANLAADRVVMLADTPYDIEAASQVGVDVIAFRCGGFRDEDLAGAIAIYNDPADLLDHYEGSPLGQG